MAGSVWPWLDITLGLDGISSWVDEWNTWQSLTSISGVLFKFSGTDSQADATSTQIP